MQVLALKTFAGKLGLIRAGTVVTVDDRYGGNLIARNLAVLHTATPLAPEKNASLPGPERVKGNDEGRDGDAPNRGTNTEPSQESGSEENSEGAHQTDGQDRPSSSRRAGRRSKKKTSTSSRAKRDS